MKFDKVLIVNTEHFQSSKDTADFLEFRLRLHFKTSGSMAFDVEQPDANGTFLKVGTLVVHHPCDDDIKVRIMVSLTKRHKEIYWDKHKAFVMAVFQLLSISIDEPYQTDFVFGGCHVSTNKYWWGER